MKPIQIVGFTPLGVILAERFTYLLMNKSECYSNVSLIEQASSSSSLIDTQWQSVSLLCLTNLLKQCRMLQSNNSKKFGINIQSIKINKELLYSYIKISTERVQKYYLTLLKQRQITFELFNNSNESFEQLLNHNDFEFICKKRWQSYFRSLKTNTFSFSDDENHSTYVTYSHSSYHEFDQSLRLNAFHAIFQYLLSYSSVKLIGPDIFAFEFAYLLSSLGHSQIYFYRMNPNETSLLPITETNANLITLFQVFSKFIHQPLIEIDSNKNHRPILHIIEKFHQFKMNLNAEGELEYKKFTESFMPSCQKAEETKKHKRTYLETFRQRTQESFTKFSTSNIHINRHIDDVKEEPLDDFPESSTFFVLIDNTTLSDLKPHEKLSSSFPKAIRTFNSTPGALILNIYETLRKISNDETFVQLTNIFLSVDHELCVVQNQTAIKNGQFGLDRILQSQQHDLKRSVENLHDLHKIIQRPMDEMGQCTLYESQLFQNDALDLQSLLLLFNPQKEIPKNELIFLFYNEHDWHNLIVLPDHTTIKNTKQYDSTL